MPGILAYFSLLKIVAVSTVETSSLYYLGIPEKSSGAPIHCTSLALTHSAKTLHDCTICLQLDYMAKVIQALKKVRKLSQ